MWAIIFNNFAETGFICPQVSVFKLVKLQRIFCHIVAERSGVVISNVNVLLLSFKKKTHDLKKTVFFCKIL